MDIFIFIFDEWPSASVRCGQLLGICSCHCGWQSGRVRDVGCVSGGVRKVSGVEKQVASFSLYTCIAGRG